MKGFKTGIPIYGKTKRLYSVRYCENSGRERTLWDRDVNIDAAINIFLVFLRNLRRLDHPTQCVRGHRREDGPLTAQELEHVETEGEEDVREATVLHWWIWRYCLVLCVRVCAGGLIFCSEYLVLL
jgi:hypothetical protein